MGIAKISIALNAKGFRVVAASDGTYTATKGAIAYGYSEEGEEIYFERVVNGVVDLVGAGVTRLLELVSEE